jgi:16S rRNA (uracil1498-N3)-methyltransferase
VLRLGTGATLRVFNGRDGEWLVRLVSEAKKATRLEVLEMTQPQTAPGNLHLLFAPLRQARFDYMVQKAVEMGASRLLPVITRHTQVTKINEARLRANVVEAAEQCGILSIATVAEPVTLERYLSQRNAQRLLVFCDEAAAVANPMQALHNARAANGVDLLVGPEGGFAEEERAILLRQPLVLRISLGPRILRADTAAVAALALVQAGLGDWTGGSPG